VGEPIDLGAALGRTLGHAGFRAGQEELVRAAMEGRDALGILPTGGGKSVCFQLPAFLLPGMVLVVSPLISLMEDQVGRARNSGLRADLLSSFTPAQERGAVVDRALMGKTDVLLVAPERFQVPGFRRLLADLPVSLLAVDEAHCIAQWGHDFRPAYLRIGEVRPELSVSVLALTATATPRVREEIEASLHLRDPLRVVGSFDRPNLVWEVRTARGHGEKIRTIRSLLGRRMGATIVYASTRRTVEAVRSALASWGLPALDYHAGLSPARRTEVQQRFLRDPAPVVVATNAFGMGIDRPDVRMVVHYQLSGSLEAYYQEAGRAGRDGRPARCVALWGPTDRRVHDAFVALAHPEMGELTSILRWLCGRVPRGLPTAIPSSATMGSGVGWEGGQSRFLAGLRALSRAGAVALEEDTLTLLDPGVDLTPLSGLRRIAEAQVASVERYAKARSCRRRKLLEYFGQEVSEKRCGRCDRCSRPAHGRMGELVLKAPALFGWSGSQ
jgi:ATP-dependent DNA helicase RecQ